MEQSTTQDPVCGRPVDPLRARAVGIFGGTTYYFCSADCKAAYADPRQAPREPAASAPAPTPSRKSAVTSEPAKQHAEPAVSRSVPSSVAAVPAPEPAPAAKRSRGVLVVAGVIASAGAFSLARWMGAEETAGGKANVKPSASASANTNANANASANVAASANAAANANVAPSDGAKPSVAKPAPPSSAKVLADLQPPIKLGLRRFVDRGTRGTVFSARLLVIDAAGRTEVVELARVEPPEIDAPPSSESVAPTEDFLSARAEPGVIFSDTFHAGDDQVDVRVEREAGALVASTRHGSDWTPRLRVPLAETAMVRAAPFSRTRYEPTKGSPAE